MMNFEPLVALLVGTILGSTFHLLHLPVPAPPSVAGVVGVVGVSLGYWITKCLFP